MVDRGDGHQRLVRIRRVRGGGQDGPVDGLLAALVVDADLGGLVDGHGADALVGAQDVLDREGLAGREPGDGLGRVDRVQDGVGAEEAAVLLDAVAAGPRAVLLAQQRVGQHGGVHLAVTGEGVVLVDGGLVALLHGHPEGERAVHVQGVGADVGGVEVAEQLGLGDGALAGTATAGGVQRERLTVTLQLCRETDHESRRAARVVDGAPRAGHLHLGSVDDLGVDELQRVDRGGRVVRRRRLSLERRGAPPEAQQQECEESRGDSREFGHLPPMFEPVRRCAGPRRPGEGESPRRRGIRPGLDDRTPTHINAPCSPNRDSVIILLPPMKNYSTSPARDSSQFRPRCVGPTSAQPASGARPE